MNLDNFFPHSFCLARNPHLLLLMSVSNAMIALAYILIPACIFIALVKIEELSTVRDNLIEHRDRIGGLFIAFILSCGGTHIMDIVVLYHPLYWAQGFLLLATGIISLATAITLGLIAFGGD